MCGICCILRYSGESSSGSSRPADVSRLLQALKNLEFKGYDSAGVAFSCPEDDGQIRIVKSPGKLERLQEEVDKVLSTLPSPAPPITSTSYSTCVGHTRWATHGSAHNVINCHPQVSEDDNEFVVVHNGIVENHKVLSQFLSSKGYSFSSETDTEVVAKLAHFIYHEKGEGKRLSFKEVVDRLCLHISGAYSLLFLSSLFPGECVATCKGSVLHIGLKGDRFKTKFIKVTPQKEDRTKPSGEGGDATVAISADKVLTAPTDDGSKEESKPSSVEYFICSDQAAIVGFTNKSIKLRDNDVAHISSRGDLSVHQNFLDNLVKEGSEDAAREILSLQHELELLMKGGYATFMLKEIMEQPESIFNCMRGRVDLNDGSDCRVIMSSLQKYVDNYTFRKVSRMVFVGTGTSRFSVLGARALLEEMTEAPIFVEDASDFLDLQLYDRVRKNDVLVFVSQSGESEYTCAALESVKRSGAVTMGITNVVGSTISRDTEIGCHVRAGPQIAIASTKAYTSQLLALNMLACLIGKDYNSKQEKVAAILGAMQDLPDHLRTVFQLDSRISELAADLCKRLPHGPVLMVGRGCSYGTILEGALKFKEVTYMSCQGIHAGELKHGPLAQIDPEMPVIFVIPKDSVYEKSLLAISQLVTRSARVLAITTDDNTDLDDMAGVETVFKVPKTEESLQGILTVVPLQLLAYHMAICKGRDVDNPRRDQQTRLG